MSDTTAARTSRWQFRLSDLLFLSLLAWAGIFLVAPVYRKVFDWDRREALETVCLVLAATFVAFGLALARVSVKTGGRLKPCMICYTIAMWLLIGWWGLASMLDRIILAVPVLPALAFAIWRSAKHGISLLNLEGSFLAALSLSSLSLAVFHAMFTSIGYSAGESAGIAACKTYAAAQDHYCRRDWDGDGVLEYAQCLGGKLSLYEINPGSGDLQLVDTAFAIASQPALGKPKAGYFFRPLTAQGPNAPGGRQSYMSSPTDMTRGFALVAWPARYDRNGRNTFIINHTGKVYLKDLGPETANIVAGMTEYDPGPGWLIAE